MDRLQVGLTPRPESPRRATRASGSPTQRRLEGVRPSGQRLLEDCGWKVSGRGHAADRLGLSRTTLLSKKRKLRIARPRQ